MKTKSQIITEAVAAMQEALEQAVHEARAEALIEGRNFGLEEAALLMNPYKDEDTLGAANAASIRELKTVMVVTSTPVEISPEPVSVKIDKTWNRGAPPKRGVYKVRTDSPNYNTGYRYWTGLRWLPLCNSYRSAQRCGSAKPGAFRRTPTKHAVLWFGIKD